MHLGHQLTAAEVLENPEMIKEIKQNHINKLDGQEYICPIPKDVIPNQI